MNEVPTRSGVMTFSWRKKKKYPTHRHAFHRSFFFPRRLNRFVHSFRQQTTAGAAINKAIERRRQKHTLQTWTISAVLHCTWPLERVLMCVASVGFNQLKRPSHGSVHGSSPKWPFFNETIPREIHRPNGVNLMMDRPFNDHTLGVPKMRIIC